MIYEKNGRDRQLEAFMEGSFFGFVTALLVFVLASPPLKAVVIGFSGYAVFIVLRGLIDYNRKRKRR